MRFLLQIALVTTLLAPQEPQQVFRTGVNVVRLDVTVLDEQRRPVTGLTAADFTILENGESRPIVAFDEINVPVTTVEEDEAEWVARAASDVPSNLLPEGRLLVIVMDDATMPHDPNIVKSAKAIARGAIDRLGPHDLAAVVFTQDNRRAQNFTADRARLEAAVDSFKAGFYRVNRSEFVTIGDRTLEHMSIRTLQAAASYLAQVPDRRKAVIYVTCGLPIAEEGLLKEIVQLERSMAESSKTARGMLEAFDLALRANVQIYPIDPSGLGGWQFYMENQLRNAARLSPSAIEVINTQAKFNREYMQTFAKYTGGRVTTNTNEFDTGLDRVFVETSHYYFLGYEMAVPEGRYRRLEVRVNKPGLTVQARQGQFAPSTKAATAKKPDPTDLALSHLLPRADIPMHLALAPFATGRREAAVSVTLGLNLREALAGSAADGETIAIQAQGLTVEGKSVGSFRQEMRIPASWKDLDRQDALAVLALPPGSYEVRVSAAAASGRAGSVYGYVDVPDFTRAPLSMSGVLIASPDIRQAQPAAALAGIAPVVPTTTRAFAAGERAGAFVRIYQAGRSMQPVTVLTRIVDTRGTDVSRKEDVLPLDRFTRDAPGVDHTVELPIAALEPGAYLLVIEATAGREQIARQVRFEVR